METGEHPRGEPAVPGEDQPDAGIPAAGALVPGTLSALQWACIDSGRWDEALAAAREAADAAAAYKMESVAASADLAAATVLAMRGDHDQVSPLLTQALSVVDAAEYRAFAARAGHAAGIAALAEGSHLTAYAQLSQLFDDDGAPLHHHVSYLAIADLAAAASARIIALRHGLCSIARFPISARHLDRRLSSVPHLPRARHSWTPPVPRPDRPGPRKASTTRLFISQIAECRNR